MTRRAVVRSFFTVAITVFAPCVRAQGTPNVARAEVPRYPGLALQAGITGTVRIDVTLRNGKLSHLKVNSPEASPVLVNAAKENLLTWEFVERVDTAFAVVFVYELSRQRVKGAANPEVLMRLPTYVRVRGMRPRPTVLRSTPKSIR